MAWIQDDTADDRKAHVLYLDVFLWPDEARQLHALEREGMKLDDLILCALTAESANKESAYWKLQVAEHGLNGFIGCAIEAFLEANGNTEVRR